jgi:hypothetical protein
MLAGDYTLEVIVASIKFFGESESSYQVPLLEHRCAAVTINRGEFHAGTRLAIVERSLAR